MERITRKTLDKLCERLNTLAGGNGTLSVEAGSIYTSWKLCARQDGRTILYANTARGLYDQMHAFKEGIYYAQERKR